MNISYLVSGSYGQMIYPVERLVIDQGNITANLAVSISLKNCTSAIAHCMQVRYIVLSSMNAASLWEYRSGGAEEWLVLQKTKLLKKRPIFCRGP